MIDEIEERDVKGGLLEGPCLQHQGFCYRARPSGSEAEAIRNSSESSTAKASCARRTHAT